MELWGLLLPAIGLAVFFEGLPYFVSPDGVRRMLRQIETWSDATLRALGLLMMTLGLTMAFLFTR